MKNVSVKGCLKRKGTSSPTLFNVEIIFLIGSEVRMEKAFILCHWSSSSPVRRWRDTSDSMWVMSVIALRHFDGRIAGGCGARSGSCSVI